jgi:phosphatidylglycerol:prolipoprotein diacylglycerol transferase
MHPILFHIGSLPIGSYALFALLATAASILIVRHYARIEGRDPTEAADAILMTCIVGFFGARVWEVAINWDEIMASPRPLQRILGSAGVFVGAITTAVPFGVYWFRRIKLPIRLGLDLLGLVAAMADGVGRWGCFLSGCCWGAPTTLPWGVTFPLIARQLHAGLPDQPVHPAQIYFSLVSFAILGVLIWVYRRKRFHGQIIATYLVLYSITRFFLEYIRGDAERGFVLNGLMSTSQFVSILIALGAVVWLYWLARRHRESGAKDWQPARRLH